MIPLLVAGAVSLTSNVIDAWKTHAANVATAEAAKGADFQKTMKAAAAEASAATERQQQAAIPGEVQSVTRQILDSPDVRSMARSNPSASVNVQFNSNGDLYASQPGGGLRRITVSADVQQQLQQLNSALRDPAAAAYKGVAQSSGEIAGSHLPVTVRLVAV